MISAKNMPSLMCPGCSYYEFHKEQSTPHHCNDNNSFTNGTKCGQDPNRDGTAQVCKKFKPR